MTDRLIPKVWSRARDNRLNRDIAAKQGALVMELVGGTSR